jgi:hypothetical protein
MRLTTVLSVVLALGIAGCGTSSTHACVTVPQSIPDSRLLTNGTKLTVPVGAIVYVALVEAEEYSSGPGFPWLTPVTSNRAVLVPVRLCKRTGASSLAVTVTGFRALRPGKAMLTAALAPRWRSLQTSPKPSLNRVTVS